MISESVHLFSHPVVLQLMAFDSQGMFRKVKSNRKVEKAKELTRYDTVKSPIRGIVDDQRPWRSWEIESTRVLNFVRS